MDSKIEAVALIQTGRCIVYNQHARVYTKVWMTHQAETLAVHLDGQMESVMFLTGAAGGLAGVLTQLNKHRNKFSAQQAQSSGVRRELTCS